MAEFSPELLDKVARAICLHDQWDDFEEDPDYDPWTEEINEKGKERYRRLAAVALAALDLREQRSTPRPGPSTGGCVRTRYVTTWRIERVWTQEELDNSEERARQRAFGWVVDDPEQKSEFDDEPA